MGWMIGLFGNFSNKEIKKIKSIYPSPLHSFQTNKIFIASGGIPETCLTQKANDNSSIRIVCGIGIKYENNESSLMDKSDWNSELEKKDFSQFNLNGHFAIARLSENQLELFTDQLGVRNIYLTKLNDCIAFSTRLDWISKLDENISIDWEEFGARWLLVNQLSGKSILKSVERMSQGSKAIFKTDPVSVKISNSAWHPDFVQTTENKNLDTILKDFTLCGVNTTRKLSLALSGGLDSRILLALLLSSNSRNYCLHSINNPNDPDRKIAARISEELNVEHFFWEQFIPSVDKSVSMINEFIGQTMLAVPASALLNTQFYSLLYNQNKIVIDGSWGEIARRRLFVSLQLKGCKAIYENDYAKLIPLLLSRRPEFFNKEYLQVMNDSLENHIENFCKAMPSVSDFGIGNWLDLFALRTRLPNSSAPEQARSDSEFINYMPFIQPTFLKKIFETQVKERNNNKIFYKIINDSYPALSRFPLVKDGVIYPFWLKTIPAAFLTKLKQKFGFVYKDTLVIRFLETLSEYIQDTFNSTETSSCDYYDHNKVKKILNEFYQKKDYNFAGHVNWLLSFETWRRTIN